MRRVSMLAVAVVAMALSGCFHGYVVTGNTPGQEEHEVGVSWLWGLTSTRTVAAECANGLAMGGSFIPWWGHLVSWVTVGIVTPVETSFSCNADQPQYVYPPGPTGVPQPPPPAPAQ